MKNSIFRALPLLAFGLLITWFAIQRPSFSLVAQEQVTVPLSSKPVATPIKMGRTPGIDLSHFQGSVNWPDVTQQDVKFVFAKASQGVSEADPKYQANAKGAREAGMLFGAYHFFSPNKDGKAQAEHFLKTAALTSGYLPPVVDVETLAKNLTNATLVKQIDIWLSTVHTRLGCQPILYASPAFYEAHLTGVSAPYHYWLASYSTEPRLPKDVKAWLFWQHSQSGKIKGISGTVDLDWFAGSPSDLEALICK